jgi:predicted amidohydrolase
MPHLRVALAQLSPTVGALEANLEALLDAYARAEAAGCDLVAFPRQAGRPDGALRRRRRLRRRRS